MHSPSRCNAFEHQRRLRRAFSSDLERGLGAAHEFVEFPAFARV
jgi:hypothetical protein